MNKHLLTAATALFLFTQVFSQQPIVFQSADIPVVPWNNRIAVDTLPLPNVNYGQKGANQVYDFSNLVLFKHDTVEYRALTGPQSSKFPNANQAITTDGRNFLFARHNVNSNYIWEGLEGDLLPNLYTDIQFNPKPEIYKFPTQFGGTFSGSYASTKIVSGSSVGQPSVGNVKVEFTATYADTVDGWGKVITPVGAYKCLRVKRVERNRTKIDASSTIFPNLYSIAVSDTRDTITRYAYLTKETKGSVVTFTYDSLDNLTTVSWSTIPPAAPVADFSFGVGPNGQVTFTDKTDGYPTAWSWNYGDNTATGSQQNPSHTYSANGSYYVCLTVTNAGGSNTFCDSVRVTTIAAINQKPIAKNDSTFCTQGDSVTLSPLANDSDPDFNTLSITNVYNPQNGTATLIGNNVKYKPNTAFTGWDFFDYRVCDNGSPVLCDTGRVYVQVIPKPANQKPIAVNDSTVCQQPFNVIVNALSNDSDPDQNSLSITNVFNFQNGTATTNGVSATYQPNAGFSGWDFFDYKICDNGSPSLCDTARIYVQVLAEQVQPTPPIADFDYSASASGLCNGYTFNSTSQNADSISWIFTKLSGAGADTVIAASSFSYYTTAAASYKVCLYAFNDDGVDSVCINLNFDCASSIKDAARGNYKLYPNPARDVVFVENSSNLKAIRIYDLAGRLVSETVPQSDSIVEINTAAIHTGSYIAEIVLRDNTIAGRSKLMIQK